MNIPSHSEIMKRLGSKIKEAENMRKMMMILICVTLLLSSCILRTGLTTKVCLQNKSSLNENEVNAIVKMVTSETNRIFERIIIWSCTKQDLSIFVLDEIPETGSFELADLIWSDAQGKYFIGTNTIVVQTKLGFIISQYGGGEFYDKHRSEFIMFDSGTILHEYGHYLGYWRHNDRPYSIMNPDRICIGELEKCTL